MKRLLGILTIFSFLFWGCNGSFNPAADVENDTTLNAAEDPIEEPMGEPVEEPGEEPAEDPEDDPAEDPEEEYEEEPEESEEFDGTTQDVIVAPNYSVSRVQVLCTEATKATGKWVLLCLDKSSKVIDGVGTLSVETTVVNKADMNILNISFSEGEKKGEYVMYVYEKCGKYYKYTITFNGTFTGNEVLSLDNAKVDGDADKSVYKYKI